MLHKNSKQQLSLNQFFKKASNGTPINKTYQSETVASSHIQESDDNFKATNNAWLCSTHSSKIHPVQEHSKSGELLACGEVSASGEVSTSGEVSASEVLAGCKSALDWSRDARRQRLIEATGGDSKQSLITDYGFVVDEMEQLTHKNEILHNLVETISQQLKQASKPTGSSFPIILQHLIKNAEKNAGKAPTGRRHLEVIKKFAISLFIYTGPMAYNFLQQNITLALPSLRTVQSQVYSEYSVISEGEFRFDKLSEHIKRYQLSGIVTIGEDATRVIS